MSNSMPRQCGTADDADPYPDEYTVVADDDAEVPVSRLGNPAGPAVVMVPGMCDNRRIYWTADKKGLANHLVDRGYDVWIVERRGTRDRRVPSGVRRGWDEVVRLDLPAVQRFIDTRTTDSAIWLGHSYGGVVISRALGEHALDERKVSGVVLVGSAIDVPLMHSRLLRGLAGVRWWGDPLPTHILGFGPEDEYRDQLYDMFTAADSERSTAPVATQLASVTTPVLEVAGHWDVLSPPKACDRLARGYGSVDRRRVQISRRNGFTSDFGHDTLLMNTRRPRTDVFDVIAEWIATHTGKRRTENSE